MNSIEINKKHKENKKEAKQIQSMKDKMEKQRKKLLETRNAFWATKQKKAIEKLECYYETKRQKDIAKRTKANEEKRDNKIKNEKRKLKGNKPVKYKKKISWTKEFGKLLVLIQKYTRVREASPNGYCTCFTCDCIRHYKAMNGGHAITRSRKSTAYLEMNINVQCNNCNNYLGGNYIVYKERLDDKYGEGTWQRLRDESQKPIDKTTHGIDWILSEQERYKKLIEKEMKKFTN